MILKPNYQISFRAQINRIQTFSAKWRSQASPDCGIRFLAPPDLVMPQAQQLDLQVGCSLHYSLFIGWRQSTLDVLVDCKRVWHEPKLHHGKVRGADRSFLTG